MGLRVVGKRLAKLLRKVLRRFEKVRTQRKR
jgi:hypothetical protein